MANRFLPASATLAVALLLSGCATSSQDYADRPVSEWPSQQVLRSLPDT
jgi:hypothetical protein